MNLLAIYAMLVLLVALLALAVAYNFQKHRFVGDRTPYFLALFAFIFVATIVFTLSLVRYDALFPGEGGNGEFTEF